MSEEITPRGSADLSENDEEEQLNDDVLNSPFIKLLGNSPTKLLSNQPGFGFTAPIKKRKAKYSKTKDIKRSDYERLVDLRKHDSVPDDTLYDQLINIILNAKKDIKFSPSAESRAGAEKYAFTHGLRLGKEGTDINEDGVEDIVLYNKAGYPVVINGYHLKPSQFPFRKSYKEQNPTPIDKLRVGGYKGYMNHQWGTTKEFDNKGHRDMTYSKDDLPPQFKTLKDKGWHIPAAPRTDLTFYQMAMKIIGQAFNHIVKVNELIQPKKWTVKCIPRITLFSVVFMNVVDRGIINANVEAAVDIRNRSENSGTGWHYYCKWKSANKEALDEFLRENQEAIFNQLSDPNETHKILENVNYFAILAQNETPTDSEFEKLSEVAKLANKTGFKNMLTKELAITKDQIINDLFGVELSAESSP